VTSNELLFRRENFSHPKVAHQGGLEPAKGYHLRFVLEISHVPQLTHRFSFSLLASLQSPSKRRSKHEYSQSTVDSMAYFISRADEMFDKILKDFEAEGVAEHITLLHKIKTRIEIGKQTAEAGKSSLIQSITSGETPSQTAGQNSHPSPDHSAERKRPVGFAAHPTQSEAMFTVPMAPSALAGVSNRMKNEVIWRAGDRAGNEDAIEVSPQKSFESTKKDLAAGTYSLRFGLIPQTSLMHMTFDVLVESKSSGEILKHHCKLSPGEDEVVLNFPISPTEVSPNFKFVCKSSKGFLPLKVRASLSFTPLSVSNPSRSLSPRSQMLKSSDHRKKADGSPSDPSSLSPLVSSPARTASPSLSVSDSSSRGKSPSRSTSPRLLARSDAPVSPKKQRPLLRSVDPGV
jgi:hypothetical protein